MRRALFIGVDLQRDFTEPEGALEIKGAAAVLEASKRLIEHAAAREIPVLLTQDTHTPDDPVFESFPPHGVLEMPGHELAPALGLGEVEVIPNRPLDHRVEVVPGRPVVVHSPNHRQGFFGNLNADEVLEAAEAEEHVVFGLPIEVGLRAMVVGLRARNKTTILVSDGIGHLDGDRASFHLAALAGMGCHFLPVEAVLKRYA